MSVFLQDQHVVPLLYTDVTTYLKVQTLEQFHFVLMWFDAQNTVEFHFIIKSER